MEREELKPCPLCGSKADYIGEEERGYHVQCTLCRTRGPWGDYGYQAREGWNRRATITPIDGEAQAAKGLVTVPSALFEELGVKITITEDGVRWAPIDEESVIVPVKALRGLLSEYERLSKDEAFRSGYPDELAAALAAAQE